MSLVKIVIRKLKLADDRYYLQVVQTNKKHNIPMTMFSNIYFMLTPEQGTWLPIVSYHEEIEAEIPERVYHVFNKHLW